MIKINRRNIAPFCECGCGERVSKHTQKPRWNRFIKGHTWNKNKYGIYSKEYLEKLRISHLGQSGYWQDKKRYKETKDKVSKTVLKLWANPEYREKHLGENNPNWKENKTKERYSEDWNKSLREAIRQRDNYQCQVCKIPQEQLERQLAVHHIDYNKKNCHPNNLISLCCSCHMKTNGKKETKEKWKLFFNERNSL